MRLKDGQYSFWLWWMLIFSLTIISLARTMPISLTGGRRGMLAAYVDDYNEPVANGGHDPKPKTGGGGASGGGGGGGRSGHGYPDAP